MKDKDLGVTMNANMIVSEQCRNAASKGNQVLGIIRRNITYKENSLIVPLYKAIAIPDLEYSIQAWCPYLRKYIDRLDKLQRRGTKLIPGLRYIRLAGLPGFARDHCSIIISIAAFYFLNIYFNLFSLKIVPFPRHLMKY